MHARCAWAAALAVAAACAHAEGPRREIYKCQEAGKLVYSNAPCDSAAVRKDARIDNKPVIAIGRNNGSKNPVVDWGEKSAIDGSSAIDTGSINWADAGSIARAVSAAHDDHKGITTYEAPVLKRQEQDRVFLRSFVPDGQPATLTQIYVRSVFHGAARGYAEASDAQGAKLELVRIDSDSDCGGSYGCTVAEDIGVNVTRDYLEHAQQAGIDLRISGPGGKQSYQLPAVYVQGFLRALPLKGPQAPVAQ